MHTLHYLNADFDLSLRARPLRLRRPAVRRAADAVSVHGILLGGAGDAVLTRAGVPDGFIEYLEGRGIEVPRLLRHPGIDRAMRFRPFGWSAEAIKINEGQKSPAEHPDLDTVRRANSRSFSTELERKHFGGHDAGRPFSSLSALAEWLAGRGESADGWMVKAEHGNAGLGNRFLRNRRLSGADARFVAGLLAEDDLVFVEPRRRRLVDLCAVFTLGREGRIGERRVHETVYTSDGALIGAIFNGCAPKWREPVEGAVEIVAKELAGLGYFGPVCFDAFVYRADGKERLRPLADLNCRRPMSDAVHRLWRERLDDRVLLWRFFNSKKLCPGFEKGVAAGTDHFSPHGRRGILLTSPWEIELGGRRQRAPKLAAAFVGGGREEVLGMEGAFRRRWEKR